MWLINIFIFPELDLVGKKKGCSLLLQGLWKPVGFKGISVVKSPFTKVRVNLIY